MPQLEGLLTVINAVSRQIAEYDELIEATAREKYPMVHGLRTIFGAGTLTALSFVATISDPHRFGRSGDVGAFLGLRPQRLLVQRAHCVLRTQAPDTALRRWSLRLCDRGGARA